MNQAPGQPSGIIRFKKARAHGRYWNTNAPSESSTSSILFSSPLYELFQVLFLSEEPKRDWSLRSADVDLKKT